MAAAIVQTAGNAATGATVVASFATTPTPGNIVVAFINSDNTFTVAPSGGVRRFTFLGDQQFDIWEFTGTLPTTVTVTPSAADYVAITLVELSGVAAFDLAGTGTVTTAAATSTASSITTTAPGDIALACAAMHGVTLQIPTTPAWGNGFTAAISIPPPSAGSAPCGQWVGSKIQATAGAVGATTVTWTNSAQNVDAVILAYTAAASGNNWTQTPADNAGATDVPQPVIDPSGLWIRETTITVGG